MVVVIAKNYFKDMGASSAKILPGVALRGSFKQPTSGAQFEWN
jgi:hypothetical protein